MASPSSSTVNSSPPAANSSGFDFSSAHDNAKQLVMFVSYSADENGARAKPRLAPCDFSLCGLRFRYGVEESGSEDAPFRLVLLIAGTECLAAGWEVTIDQELTITTMQKTEKLEQNLQALFNAQSLAVKFLNFDSAVERFTLNIVATPEHIHPYRQYFVVAKFAAKYGDCTLVVDGTPVFVSRHLLSMTSPFFEDKFSFEEENIIELEDITAEEFLEYLYCIYPPNRPFAVERMPTVLKLADRFRNESLKNSCSEYLVSLTSRPDRCRVLKWADEFNLDQVFKRTVDEMNVEDLKRITRHSESTDFQPQNWKIIKKRLAMAD